MGRGGGSGDEKMERGRKGGKEGSAVSIPEEVVVAVGRVLRRCQKIGAGVVNTASALVPRREARGPERCALSSSGESGDGNDDSLSSCRRG